MHPRKAAVCKRRQNRTLQQFQYAPGFPPDVLESLREARGLWQDALAVSTGAGRDKVAQRPFPAFGHGSAKACLGSVCLAAWQPAARGWQFGGIASFAA